MGELGDDESGWARPRGDGMGSRGDRAWRSDFDIDRDRVLYSPEFRRLAGVTQVISPQEDYVFHDRLTHSLKVAQTAERLAQRLLHEYSKTAGADLPLALANVSPAVCYVAGLCHDLGHPPFGHAAEKQLQRELEDIGSKTADGPETVVRVRDGFEGNAQSYRIVSRLSLRKSQGLESGRDEQSIERGLNLTWRSLAAISKYPWTAGEGEELAVERAGHAAGTEPAPHDTTPDEMTPAEKLTNEKWGFYDTESEDLEFLERNDVVVMDGGPYLRHRSVEAEIMDWSDDIAYAVHDLEDFFRADRVPLARLRDKDAPEWEPILAEANDRLGKYFPGSPGIAGELENLRDKHVVPQLPLNPFDGSRESHAAVQRFASAWIRYLQDATTLRLLDGRFEVFVERDARIVAEMLKAINVYYVIEEPTMTVMQRGQTRVIKELFDALLTMAIEVEEKGVDKPQLRRTVPARLEAFMVNAVEESDRELTQSMARAVVDFICSLTDKQAGLLHQRIMGDAAPRLSPYWLNV